MCKWIVTDVDDIPNNIEIDLPYSDRIREVKQENKETTLTPLLCE